MRIKKIKEVEYEYGHEEYIKQLLYTSKEPLLIKIKNFTDKFTLDYFEDLLDGITTYDTYENDRRKSHESAHYTQVINQIKNNMPHRIFGQVFGRKASAAIEYYVPLWQKIPLRPRYFNKKLKVVYFFGGKGAHTEMHFDREHCCNLHLCLCGKKKLLLFTEDQSDFLYKVPFVGDTLIDFGLPMEEIKEQFPRLEQAEGYDVSLERGDMLFMPRNCWHYTTYIDASAAATYVFYPKKRLQFYGYFTGYFYMGLLGKKEGGLGICTWSLFKKFRRNYALADGRKKRLFKMIEKTSYLFLLPVISILVRISFLRRPRRVY
ncbi:cupin-like domain-containing protein [Fluoribacter dumoffii]|uniref:JmjC domain-containing protein n=1 Tax=Fluoribacter dumoffii TaxID=463 RepID=A0A377G684_9GAMM|nr:cupin-like domain-containing protein [Fluoribacter dumoffii]KTC91534.1 eukaryotic small stress protein PASS1 [Fluoribacter dumoffii NY 23]MCW8417151.1 cupin-like domain-containing protein [Fluoribacter dumoffii]MCW8455009.1 cupin-like domain-containing protein [Fluoribacter dumoffii]MCW8460914.1 cupin-like domain-containing protein [Fluoribacter dumoffii]MCW8484356.1 cupin-like domain-containing protein [Fluoribacter dumoffii]